MGGFRRSKFLPEADQTVRSAFVKEGRNFRHISEILSFEGSFLRVRKGHEPFDCTRASAKFFINKTVEKKKFNMPKYA